ncbi:hypothetical protein IH764_26765, partial [Escherichia coli]|uniref:carbohydrate-binding protein n=1 Tax=Escherichia coli TaxID=562 RepID=UPI0019DEA28E|nr:hypothetical protein [Escherichia coli]
VVNVVARSPSNVDSAPAVIRVDGVAPPAPVIDPSNGTDISGTAEAGATVILTDGNGNPIGQTAGLSLADSGLTPATQYSYFVTATDTLGNTSLPSSALAVKTANDGTPPDPGAPEWQNTHSYKAGDVVSYKGKKYTCIQAHTSNAGWTPDAAFTLWQLIA